MTSEEALVKVRGYLTDYLPLDNADEIDEIIKALEQQPSEDCISRKEVISEIDKYIDKAQSTGTRDDFISFQE